MVISICGFGYLYEKCGTCRSALKYIEKKKIKVEVLPIVESPPSLSELKKMLQYYKGNFKKLFNTSGLVYKAMKLRDQMDSMTEEEALTLLSQNGKLIKRPFVLGKNFGIVGFKEEEWEKVQ